ncbi:sensor histidine kinase [Rhizorhabdus dicambivorans]|uniref:histidine kinase n=1 Tax=Rhizorhabdus dicambivorans TaxID=1850238 RepID=A0A2A4FY80_9SPHN|nr:HAMP domain-containing sensor histidine kinase [Rhizorhabdus dicambivorans]ATE65296.1 sensor histidine kinase [Rhizorhabdus dicambivorans]PCE42378.1 sensor histidine kinase [Rhizorhabdus dicambivorans]
MDVNRFRGLIAIQQRIAAGSGALQDVLQAIVDETSVMPQANGVVIELRDADQLYYAAASGSSAPMVGLRLPLNASLSGMSILTGQPLQCDDSETDSRVNRAACRRVGLRSMIVVPIPHQGQTVGVLKYHAPQIAAFTDEDMLVAHLLVGPIAVGFSSIAEADAQKASAELRKIVQLKEQFVSSVNHELRTPLTSISGALTLLTSGAVELPETAAPLIEIAARNAKRLKRLVDDLLDLDRIDGGKLKYVIEETDLCALLLDVVEQTSPFAAEAGVRLTLDAPRRPVLAMTDGDRLFQVVANLISNAAKFSPAGSTVQVILLPASAGARIRVVDEGPGIPAEFRPRLFDRFSQSPHTEGLSNMPGTGLGLAISRSIVEQLGGKLDLDETYFTGAAFEISLPLRAPALRQDAA